MRASRLVSRLLRLVLSTVLAIFASEAPLAAQSAVEGLPSYAEPGVSPDGSEIAFVSGGDVWTVSSLGGAARLLVAHSANESRPLYSPDGRSLAFNSDRDGGLNVYVMDLTTGVVSRLTHPPYRSTDEPEACFQQVWEELPGLSGPAALHQKQCHIPIGPQRFAHRSGYFR